MSEMRPWSFPRGGPPESVPSPSSRDRIPTTHRTWGWRPAGGWAQAAGTAAHWPVGPCACPRQPAGHALWRVALPHGRRPAPPPHLSWLISFPSRRKCPVALSTLRVWCRAFADRWEKRPLLLPVDTEDRKQLKQLNLKLGPQGHAPAPLLKGVLVSGMRPPVTATGAGPQPVQSGRWPGRCAL